MKRSVLVIICLLAIFAISGNVMAMNTPVVVKNHGVVTWRMLGGDGIVLGVEYGFTPKLALAADFGSGNQKLGLKYEVNNSFALLGGIDDSSAAYLGINGGKPINNSLTGLYEISLSSQGEDFALMYKLGGKVNLRRAFDINSGNVDLRGGLVGTGTDDFPEITVGIGYSF